MAARGEPLARHGEDAALDAGQLGRDLNIVRHFLEQATGFLGLVLPRDAEEVERVDIPQANALELFLDLLRDGLGMLHLRDGRNNDVVFLGLLDIVRKARLVDSQIDLAHDLLLLLLFVNIRIECVLGYAEVFGDLVAGFGNEERPVLAQKADGAHLVLLVHQRDGLSDQRHRLRDELVEQLVDVDDLFRLALRPVSVI